MFCTTPQNMITSITDCMTTKQISARSGKTRSQGAKCKQDHTFALLLAMATYDNLATAAKSKLTKGACDSMLASSMSTEIKREFAELQAASRGCDTWDELQRSIPVTPSPRISSKTKSSKSAEKNIAGPLLDAIKDNMTTKQMRERSGKKRSTGAKTKDDYAYALLLTMTEADTLTQAWSKCVVDVQRNLTSKYSTNEVEITFAEMKQMATGCENWMELKSMLLRGSTDLETLVQASQDISKSSSIGSSRRRSLFSTPSLPSPPPADDVISPADEERYHHLVSSKSSPFSFGASFKQEEINHSAFQPVLPTPPPALKEVVRPRRKTTEMRECLLRQQHQQKQRDRKTLARAYAAQQRARSEIQLQEQKEQRERKAAAAVRTNTIDFTRTISKSADQENDCDILTQVVVGFCVVAGCVAWYFSDPTVGTTLLPMLTAGAV